jgi:hypothetical protein
MPAQARRCMLAIADMIGHLPLKGGSRTAFVRTFSSPPGPVIETPDERARRNFCASIGRNSGVK